MSNHYSTTTNQEAIRVLFRVMNRYGGNLPPIPTSSDFPVPVVRNAGTERELRCAVVTLAMSLTDLAIIPKVSLKF